MKQWLRQALVAISSLLAVGCTTTDAPQLFFNIVPVKSSEIATELNINKKYILFTRMRQADFIATAINDKTFVDELSAPFTFNALKKQCIYNNINRNAFDDVYTQAIDKIVRLHADDIDVFIDELDFLIPITSKYYQEFALNDFDLNNLANSPAFGLLSNKQASRLQATINNEQFAPLLFAIGLPGTFDNQLMSPNKVKFARLRQLITDSATECGLQSNI